MRMLTRTFCAALLSFAASAAVAQSSLGAAVGQAQANDDFIAQHALWYTVTPDGWSIHFMEQRCPNGGRVVLMNRFGTVGLVGCYIYQKKREGFVTYWENGTRIFYGDEQIRTTLYGQNQVASARR